MIFASTLPIKDDPTPWVSPITGKRSAHKMLHSQWQLVSEDTYNPRPEFDRPRAHEANPILLELRQIRRADWARPERYRGQYETMLRWVEQPEASSEDENPWTPEQRDHARRVLSRLANFS